MQKSVNLSIISLFAFSLLVPGSVLISFGEGDPIECPASYNGGVLLNEPKISGSAIKSLTCDYVNPNYKNGDQHHMSHYEFLISYFKKPGTSSSSEQCSGEHIPYGIYDYFYSSEIYASIGIQVASKESASSHLDWAKNNFLIPLITSEEATSCTTDVDGDGIPDVKDNCPDVSNPSQLDDDENNIGNLCDEEWIKEAEYQKETAEAIAEEERNKAERERKLLPLSEREKILYKEIEFYNVIGVVKPNFLTSALQVWEEDTFEIEIKDQEEYIEKFMEKALPWFNFIEEGKYEEAKIQWEIINEFVRYEHSNSQTSKAPNEEKIIKLDRATLAPKKNQPDSIKMSGTIEDPTRGEPILFKITGPDGTTEEFSSIVTGKGAFSNKIIVDDTWTSGNYTVEGFYLGEKIESNTFEITAEIVEQVPEWIKGNAKWWSEGKIDDATFIQGIQYLIKEKILLISGEPQVTESSGEIPNWIKKNAGWWADGVISEGDFVNGIKYLVEKGIINVN